MAAAPARDWGVPPAPPGRDMTWRWERGTDFLEKTYHINLDAQTITFGLVLNNLFPLSYTVKAACVEDFETVVSTNFDTGRLTVNIHVVTNYGNDLGIVGAIGGGQRPELDYAPIRQHGRSREPMP